MKKLALTISMLALSSFAMSQNIDPEMLKTIDESILELNKQVGSDEDEDIVFTKASRKKHTLFFDYSIKTAASSAKDLDEDFLYGMKVQTCEILSETLEVGFDVRYTYTFADKSKMKLDFTKKYCEQFQ